VESVTGKEDGIESVLNYESIARSFPDYEAEARRDASGSPVLLWLHPARRPSKYALRIGERAATTSSASRSNSLASPA